ncbi:MAG: DUF427 domain-containing protein [Microbacterium sp.]|nr:DUF427 domain-containing protein [Microbacterium sp.]
MKASIDGTVIAEAPTEDLIKIEGNWYFPPTSVAEGTLTKSPTPYTCPWKGVCQYWNAALPDGEHKDAAWSYPEPYDGAAEKVGKDFANYVAFDKAQVSIAE